MTACVDANGNNNGNNNGNGKDTWVLVSTTTYPQNPQGWKIGSGSAHLDVYQGDKGDFTWTPPPGQFNNSGFDMSLSAQATPANAGGTVSLLICVGADDLKSSKEDKCVQALAPNRSSASTQFHLTPMSAYSEIEVKVDLMWGGAGTIYKYKKQ